MFELLFQHLQMIMEYVVKTERSFKNFSDSQTIN